MDRKIYVHLNIRVCVREKVFFCEQNKRTIWKITETPLPTPCFGNFAPQFQHRKELQLRMYTYTWIHVCVQSHTVHICICVWTTTRTCIVECVRMSKIPKRTQREFFLPLSSNNTNHFQTNTGIKWFKKKKKSACVMVAKAWNPGSQAHVHTTEYFSSIINIEQFPISIAHL